MTAVCSLGALAFFEGTLLGHFGNLVHSTAQEQSQIRKRKPLFRFSGNSSAATQQFELKVAACVAYVGILTVVSHGENAIAAALIATSLFFAGWIKQQSTLAEEQSPAKVALRLSRHSIWAIFVTLLALLPHAGSFSLSQLAGRLLTQEPNSNLGKLQSGVILFVKRKPLPIRLELENQLEVHSQTVARAFSIPFSGEYWFFPRPRSPVPGDDWFLQRIHKVPGASFLREEGDPININVTLEDTGEMVMQAQQRIGYPVDLRRFRWIDVILDGEDEQPQKVDIELFLVDSSAKGQAMQTLGVRSMRNPVTVSTSANLKMSSFRFTIPPASEIRSFNELLVWFHLKGPHRQKATTVKIDRFDLIP
jgi:hypothetical protein